MSEFLLFLAVIIFVVAVPMLVNELRARDSARRDARRRNQARRIK